MENTATTPTTIATKDVLAYSYIQVSLLVIAKRTFAVQLRAGVSHHFDAYKIDDIFNGTR